MTTAARPAVPMDPRIRARRVAVRRDEGRRRLRLLLVVAGSAAVLAGGWGVTRSPLLDVDEVVVSGAVRTDRRALLEAAGLDDGPQLADLDPGTVALRIETLPWVADAVVHKEWPGTLEVTVVERVAVAAVPVGPAWAEVDADGRVLAVGAQPASGLPVLEDVDAGAGVGSVLDGPARAAVTVAATLPPRLRESVASVRPGPLGVELALVPRGRVVLGGTTQLPEKLTAVATVLGDVEAITVGVLDVRVPTAPVLTRR